MTRPANIGGPCCVFVHLLANVRRRNRATHWMPRLQGKSSAKQIIADLSLELVFMSDIDSALLKVELALAGVKTLRRDVGFLVQQLAQLRDTLTATTQEGTSNEHRDSSNRP